MVKKTKSKKDTKDTKQIQTQTQKIIVNIPSLDKKKRKKTTRKKPQKKEKIFDERFFQQLPPPSYFYNVNVQQPQQPFSEPEKIKISAPEKIKTESKPIFEDVGIGREGFIEILDLPTKKETLESFIEPVSTKPRFTETLPEKIEDPFLKQEPKKFEQPKFITPYNPYETETEGIFLTEAKPIQKRKYVKSGKYSKKKSIDNV